MLGVVFYVQFGFVSILLVFLLNSFPIDAVNFIDKSACKMNVSLRNTTYCPRECISSIPPVESEKSHIIRECYSGSNLIEPPRDAIAIVDGKVELNCDQFVPKNLTLVRIELNRIENIYAVVIRKEVLRSTTTSIEVKALRNMSSSESQSFDCHTGKQDYTGARDDFIFYCYHDGDHFASGYELGIDADSVEIVGEFKANACPIFRSVEIYSYPVRLCGVPGAYEGQSYTPKSKGSYYFAGQTVTYSCTGENLLLVGDVARKCQPNGSWTGKPPTCVEKMAVKYKMEKEYISLLPGSTLDFVFPITYCIESFTVVYYYGEHRGIAAGVSKDKPWNVTNSTSNNGSFLTRREIKVYHPPTGSSLVDCTSKIVIQSFKTSSEYIYEVEIAGFPLVPENCPSPDSFPSEVQAIKTQMAERFECKSGYSQGSDVRGNSYLCENGEWKGIPSTCAKIRCPLPPSVENAHWKYDSDGVYHQVEYNCHQGFLINGEKTSSLVECTENRWANLPKCEEIVCEGPPVNATKPIGVHYDPQYKIGALLNYTCPQGHLTSEGKGSLLLSCGSTGKWEPNDGWECGKQELISYRVRMMLTVGISLLILAAISAIIFVFWKRKSRQRGDKQQVETRENVDRQDGIEGKTPQSPQSESLLANAGN